MEENNPIYVLRNYLAQQAIEQATEGNYREIENLLTLLKQPYTRQTGKEHYTNLRPAWALNQPGCSTLSCSS